MEMNDFSNEKLKAQAIKEFCAQFHNNINKAKEILRTHYDDGYSGAHAKIKIDALMKQSREMLRGFACSSSDIPEEQEVIHTVRGLIQGLELIEKATSILIEDDEK